MKTNILSAALGSLMVICAFAWVGDQDYEVAQREAVIYTEMVCSGAWGDYKNLKLDCGKVAM